MPSLTYPSRTVVRRDSSSEEVVPSPAYPTASANAGKKSCFDIGKEEREEFVGERLPRMDGGRKAWMVLIAGFFIEGLFWGFPQCFGVFQQYYVDHGLFGGKQASVVGTLQSGIMYMACAFSFPVLTRYPRSRLFMQWGGFAMFLAGCVLSSFATKLAHLIVAQGLLCGIGSAVCYAPCVICLYEWWDVKRGTAMGIMNSGTGIFGIISPLLCGWMLDKYGFRTTLRIWAIIMFVSTSVCLPFVVPRNRMQPRRSSRGANHSTSNVSVYLRTFRSPMFNLLAIGNILQAFSHFIPPLWLPSFAKDLSAKITPVQSASLVSALNGAAVIGRLISGYLSDNVNLSIPTFSSPLISAVAAFCMWGLSRNYALLMVFSIVFGCVAGGWSVLWSRFATAVVLDERNEGEGRGWDGEREKADAMAAMYAVLFLGRGLGNIATGPISSKLVEGVVEHTGFALKKYQSLVMFTAAAMVATLLTSIGGMYWRMVVGARKAG